MTQKLVLLLFFCFSTVIIIAQPTTTNISGKIIDAKDSPIQGAIITLLSVKDSSIIKTSITNSKGDFEIEFVRKGIYFLKVTHINYELFYLPAFNIDERNAILNIPNITLIQTTKQLTTVIVQAQTPFVQTKIDRTIVNVNALISNAGSNMLDVLQKSPGISVEDNGTIKLKGKGGVVIYIDDKPTYLAAEDLANYLRSLPASTVDVIEIMPNPPAKYDAAGGAGVINIKLKKNKAKGFNGSVNLSYGQGKYARTNNSINFNYRINKVNIFANSSYNINHNYQDLFLQRKYFTPQNNINSAFNQHSFIKREPSGSNIKIGLDYYINKKSTFGIVLNKFTNIVQNKVSNTATIYDASLTQVNTVTAYVPSKKTFNNSSININYAYKKDSTSSDILLNVDYIQYNGSMNNYLQNKLFDTNGNLLNSTKLNGDLPSTIKIGTAKFDYTKPIDKTQVIEVGLKTSYIATNNIANFTDELSGSITPNYDFSNNFKYTENINAAYVNYKIEKKHWSIQTGFRFENTNIQGNQLGNPIRKDSSFKQNFNSLFPTIFILYKLDSVDNHQLGFNFGRRIERPDYQAMNPFTYPLDRYTLYGGNPFLKPSFANNFQLVHTYKNKLTTTLEYSINKNVIVETIETGNNIFYSRPGNFGKQISYSATINASHNPTKWWTVQLYTSITKNIFTATLYNQSIKNEGSYWYINNTNQFTINKKWSAELSGNYQTSVYYGQFVFIARGIINIGIAKKILENKGSLKLNVADAFYVYRVGGDIKGLANSTANWFSYYDSRFVTIAFSYRFTKGKSKQAREVGGSETEKGRVKMN